MSLATLNFLLCLAATLFMTGVIWAVQLALYPLFANVGDDGWAGYHAAHTSRISLVVVAPMLAELASAALLVALPPDRLPSWVAWVGLLLVGVVWASTMLLSVPYHNQLPAAVGATRDAAIAGLVATNWVRTAAWTARSLLLLYGLVRMLGG